MGGQYIDGQLRQSWDLTSGYTAYDAAGKVIEQRPLTRDEIASLNMAAAQAQRDANAETLRTNLRQALGPNAAYLALKNPTPPQTTVQAVALTRQCDALIRLLLGLFDDVSGT